MLIAQISDCHIGFFRTAAGGANSQRLQAVLARLQDGPNRPDLLLLSGDLTEFGDAASYARLTRMLAGLPFPVVAMVGNHDDRRAHLAAFPGTSQHDGFVQSEYRLTGLRLIMIDTLEPGRHGGGFCADRADWLRDRLAADSETPVVIAMHHPPVETGLSWLDCDAREPWIARFAETITGHAQVRAILCGHLHRSIHAVFAGIPVTVCPSSAATVALDLSPIDPGHADGRAMIVDEPAAFALHRWDGRQLVSHVEMVASGQPWPVLARYDTGMLSTVRQIDDERPV